MNVWVIYTGPYPEGNVTTHRVHHLCKGLAENQVDVQLLVTQATETDAQKNKHASGIHEGVKFQYIGGKTLRNQSFIRRKWADFRCYAQTLLSLARHRKNYDQVLVIGPSVDFRLFIPVLMWLLKKPCVLEINEYPFVRREKSLSSRSKRAFFQSFVVPFYSGFVVISENLSKWVTQYKSAKASIIKIPILVNPELGFAPSPVPVSGPYFIHAGSLWEEKDGMLGILEALNIVKKQCNQAFRYVITGGVSAQIYAYFQEKIKHWGLENEVVFTGYLSENDLYNYLKNSTLAIINKQNTTQNQYCFATKLGLYLANAVPVITTDIGEASYYLRHLENAYLLHRHDPETLAQTICHVLENPTQAKRIGEAGKALCINQFHYHTQGKTLSSFVVNLGNQ